MRSKITHNDPSTIMKPLEPPKVMQTSCCTNAVQKSRPDYMLWFGGLFVGSLYALYWLGSDFTVKYPWLQEMTHTIHSLLHTMWWGVALGALFVGLLAKVPRLFIMSILGEGGTFNGLLRATAAGVLLDLCSHGILMVGVKLYERGASGGQLIAFLVASPWNSFSLTLILFSLIGFGWTLTFILVSMVIALISGFIFDKLIKAGLLSPNPNQEPANTEFRFWQEAKKGLSKTKYNGTFFKDVLTTGVKDSRMVVRWLLIGILLASILRVALDTEQFAAYFGPSILGLVLTVALATVLEVCSEGSAPIAADILTRAAAPGNGFAFLMAGVATDYTEIMILRDTTRSWRFAFFLPLITLPQVIFFAWLMQ